MQREMTGIDRIASICNALATDSVSSSKVRDFEAPLHNPYLFTLLALSTFFTYMHNLK